MSLRVVVLGSAAGGGFPQWNCACPACRRARAGDPAAAARTQASIAVSADGRRWAVLNASPDLRAQINATPALHPRGLRDSPVAAVLLTGAEIDGIAGLLTLRENHAFALYASEASLAVLDQNPIFAALPPARVPRRVQALDMPVSLQDAAGEPLGLVAEAFAVPGKVPLFAETDGDPGHTEDGVTVGLRIAAEDGRALFFIPGCAAMTDALRARLRGAALVLFDGTLWRDDEMRRAGLGEKTGQRMGHMSIDGEDGAIAAFRDLGVRRRVLIHINNSNPILLADSPERAAAEAAGWEVAHDGMEIEP
ncbi:MAG TPA: pyrroloquinoline quinone biosynthesis protein PqqB [Acetobacteraceae bacterium]|jgi:pyrroloquinoline quinone biosynthesis protein B